VSVASELMIVYCRFRSAEKSSCQSNYDERTPTGRRGTEAWRRSNSEQQNIIID